MPLPAGAETAVVAGGAWAAGTVRPAPAANSWEDLLALHGPAVGGYLLVEVLDHATDDDLPELRDPLLLEAFARALAADGRVRPLPPTRLAAELEVQAAPEAHQQADNSPTGAEPWRPAWAAYDAHHWRCLTCQRAGRRHDLARCPEGEVLHAAYSAAVGANAGRAVR